MILMWNKMKINKEDEQAKKSTMQTWIEAWDFQNRIGETFENMLLKIFKLLFWFERIRQELIQVT